MSGDLDNTFFGIYSILMGESAESPKTALVTKVTETYLKEGVGKMLQQYQTLINDSTYNLGRTKNFLNNFGYTLLTKGEVKKSLQVLRMAAEEQPENANVLDSYAEALKADGQMDMALEYYRRILILQPDDERIRQEIKNLQAVKK